MRIRYFFPLVVFLAFVSASAQGQQQLPSAPSAVAVPKQPAPAPAAAPATTPQTVAPTPPKPELKDLYPQQPAPPVPSATKPEAKVQPAAVKANPDPDINTQGVTTIIKRVDEVNVVFTVTDKHGHFVKDLTKNDFKVLDDNKPPRAIDSFRSETDLPLRVGLLIDSSNSVRDRFKFEQESAIEFLNQIIRPRYDKAFVIGFDTTAEVTQDFTDNSEALSHGVRELRPGGGTAMFDALYFACRDKLMKADQPGSAVRRAIILISDGNDNQSRVTREEAIEMAQRADAIVYTISTNTSGIKERGDKVLERIADATGGRAFAPFKIQDVANAFAEIQQELRSQYALSYKPADFVPDGHFRSIDITALNRKGLQVRARKGWYAPTK